MLENCDTNFDIALSRTRNLVGYELVTSVESVETFSETNSE